MPFINTTTLEYPLSERDIRQRHPSTLFPVPFFAPDGFAPVFASPMPAFDQDTQYIAEAAPVRREADGKWFQSWAVHDLPPVDDQEAEEAA